MTVAGKLHIVIGVLVLLAIALSVGPARAAQPASVNPQASAATESEVLQRLNTVEGRGTLPDLKSQVILQREGRSWQQFRTGALRWIGAIVILGVLAVLVLFYLRRGMVRIESGRSGHSIVRFGPFERFVHWMTAVSFVILAITGLNVTFGRPIAGGGDAFSAWSQAAKYAHDFLSFPFTIGVILIFLMWIAGNIPNRTDVEWFKNGGGFGKAHAAAGRFNGGQKAIYWIVVLGGAAMAVSGYLLLFPFYGTGIHAMQRAEMVHGIIAMLFIAAMLGHIYVGTIGMQGAFEAMGKGTVDANWARQHHSLWRASRNARAMPPAE